MKMTEEENGLIMKLKGEQTQLDAAFHKDMFEVMVQDSPVSMYILNDWSFSYVNKHFCVLTGYSEEEMLIDEKQLNKLIHPDDLFIVKDRILNSEENQETYARYRLRLYKKDGEMIYIEVHSKKILKNGQSFLFGSVFEVTGEVIADLRLRENQERFESLFYNNPDAVFTFDLEGNFTDLNPACEELTGYSKQELMEMSFSPFIVPEDMEVTQEYFGQAAKGIPNNHDITMLDKDGKRKNIEITKFPVKQAGEIVGVYGIAKDITERIEHKKIMEELIFFDSLTKLPNRKLFEDRLTQILNFSELNGKPTAVLFLDLDRFKFINDSLGHHLGDEFLKIVSKRLADNVRLTDTVGRFAGDEFAILLPNTGEEESIKMAERLNQVLVEPFDIDGHSLSISASIGIAFSKGIGESVDELVKKADIAMYHTKKYGKNSFTVYSEELDQNTAYKLAIEEGLRSAIDHQEFVLHYQPITNLKTGELSAMEALIRWNHPDLGMVPPDQFIPVSEESGQIISIGTWVLQTACLQNKAWQAEGIHPFKICVNISTIQLQHPNFLQTVKKTLEETGLDAEWLELEVTESILMENTETLKESLANLKSLGISISIDDFGTGYTSLSYLRQFSFNRVKIDRSFIGDISHDLNGKEITSTIISLAHKLNMDVTAEGIEDEIQLTYLREENCDGGQGYFFSRPLPVEMHKLTNTPKKFW